MDAPELRFDRTIQRLVRGPSTTPQAHVQEASSRRQEHGPRHPRRVVKLPKLLFLQHLSRQTQSTNAEHLVCLEAQPPAWMLQAVAHRSHGILRELRPIHGLQKEMVKRQPFEPFRLRAYLGIDKFELISVAKCETRSRFWAHANPVHSAWRRFGSVGFDGDLEPLFMEGVDQGGIELKQRF